MSVSDLSKYEVYEVHTSEHFITYLFLKDRNTCRIRIRKKQLPLLLAELIKLQKSNYATRFNKKLIEHHIILYYYR